MADTAPLGNVARLSEDQRIPWLQIVRLSGEQMADNLVERVKLMLAEFNLSGMQSKSPEVCEYAAASPACFASDALTGVRWSLPPLVGAGTEPLGCLAFARAMFGEDIVPDPSDEDQAAHVQTIFRTLGPIIRAGGLTGAVEILTACAMALDDQHQRRLEMAVWGQS